MASPLYDALSIQHSKNIGDPVAAAATDGKRWSSVQRDTHLNEACRRLIRAFLSFDFGDEITVRMKDAGFFSGGYWASEEQTLSSNVKALSGWTGTAQYILTARNTTTNLPIYPLPSELEDFIRTSQNKYLTAGTSNMYYMVDGANLRVLGSAATDKVTLSYIKAHAALSAGGSTDILVPATYWSLVTDMAMKVAFEEYPTADNVQRAAMKEAAINLQIYGPTNTQ
jgi:hypothetical protein